MNAAEPNSIRPLLPLHEVQSDLPFTLATVYSGFARGRYPWLSKHGPDGHVGRNLWVDVPRFNIWAECRGLKTRISEQGQGGQR